MTIFLCAISVSLIFLSWHHFLDDAFIHLRYAENLIKYGFFSYNGTQSDFGTSSPGYTIILSITHSFIGSSMSPKFVSVFFYAALYVYVAYLVLVTPRTSIASLLLLCGLSSPSAVRWLTDGMETSLVAFLSAMTAVSINRFVIFPIFSRAFCCATLLAIAPLFRIEYSAIWLFATLIGVYLFHRRRTSIRSIAVIIFSIIIPLSGLYLVFGSVLPDTAVAKSNPGSFDNSLDTVWVMARDTVWVMARSHAASPLFFIFTLGAFFIGLAVLIDHSRKEYPGYRQLVAVEALLLSAMFIGFVSLITYRQQAIQGYRYFIWIEIFIAVYVVSALAYRRSINKNQPDRCLAFPITIRLILFFSLIALFIIEAYLFYPVWQGRSDTFRAMQHIDRQVYTDKTCAAYDIGFFGYFYNCRLIDMNGLVNGRKQAALSHSERLRLLSHQNVTLLFVNDRQISKLSDHVYPQLSHWAKIAEFAFPNVGGDPDIHYVLIRK